MTQMENPSLTEVDEFLVSYLALLESLEAIATLHPPASVVRQMVVGLNSTSSSPVANTLAEQLPKLIQVSSLLLEIVLAACSPEEPSRIIVDQSSMGLALLKGGKC
jgi:hypothetical protein